MQDEINSTIAGEICENELGLGKCTLRRIEIGYCSHVYNVESTQNREYILRINRESSFLMGAEFWINELKSNGDFPVPAVLKSNYKTRYPYQLMSKMKGQDLGVVYDALNETEKRDIANELCRISMEVEKLPEAVGFGYLTNYSDTRGLKKSWEHVVFDNLKRSRDRIENNEIMVKIDFDRVSQLVSCFRPYFEQIRPKAFLHDATTKNVMIKGGKLSGIVDLDEMCFGDKLFLIGIIELALKVDHNDACYAASMRESLKLDRYQMRVVDLYVLLFAVNFISEEGMRFNRSTNIRMSEERLAKLMRIYSSLLDKLRQLLIGK